MKNIGSSDNTNFKVMTYGAIALVILAAIILMGIAVTGEFSDIVRTDQTTTVTSITVPATNASVTVGLELVQDVTDCVNSTNGAVFSTDYYTVYEGTRSTNGGITIAYPLPHNDTWIGSDINCSVQNLQSNDGSDAGELFLVALAIFGTFAGIFVLAIMGKSVIEMFKKV